MDYLNLFSLKLLYKDTFCQRACSTKCHFDDSKFRVDGLVDKMNVYQSSSRVSVFFKIVGPK